MKLPLLPTKLAVDSTDELKDFVRAFLYVRDIETRQAILDCLFEEDPMLKGPFLEMRLPYKSSDKPWPLHKSLDPGYSPYVHQEKAYERLNFLSPTNTLITTGTGSGKSECFMNPLMDYVINCKTNNKQAGVKALILYPMNALIDDQGERLSELANQVNQQTGLNIRVGRYTGSPGQVKEHSLKNPKQIINDRESLCQDPPDILLTNYRMLDFMLFRSEEQNFWNQSTKHVFQYLVLDELHTFDGAQGADVACLIRRLKLKLNKSFCCVGTSATIAGGEAGKQELCNFAAKLFGDDFTPDSIIQESYPDFDSYLPGKRDLTPPDKPSNLSLFFGGKQSYENYIAELSNKWGLPNNPVELGEYLLICKLTRELVERIKPGIDLYLLATNLNLHTWQLLEFLDLLSYARNERGNFAILPLQIQTWVQETKYLLRALDKDIKFKRPSNEDSSDETDLYLPAVNCNNCGASGWAAAKQEESIPNPNWLVSNDTNEALKKFIDKKAAIFFPASSSDKNVSYYNKTSRRIIKNIENPTEAEDLVALSVHYQDSEEVHNYSPKKMKGSKTEEFHLRCPDCEEGLNLRLSSFNASMLSSVLTGNFLSHSANPDDKKYLIFNDSLQDTAHQAGYISARNFKFHLRRIIFQTAEKIKVHSTPVTTQKLINKIYEDIDSLASKSLAINKVETQEIAKQSKLALSHMVPKDLWEYWSSIGIADPFVNPENIEQLKERLYWEIMGELGPQSSLGWSLHKSAALSLSPHQQGIDKLVTEMEKVCEKKTLWNSIENHHGFIFGLINRLMKQACFYHEVLEEHYKKASFYQYTNQKPYLSSTFFGKGQRQKLVVYTEERTKNSSTKKPTEYLMSAGNSWYKKWLFKHLKATEEQIPANWSGEANEFYKELFLRFAEITDVFKKAKVQHIECLGIKPEAFSILTNNELQLYRCDRCSDLTSLPTTFSEKHQLQCLQHKCTGQYKDLTENDTEAKQFVNYMGRQFKKDLIYPLAHPHTGQLQGNARNLVETAFKNDLVAGEKLFDGSKQKHQGQPINVLTCTPTMEMGIDIGSLSGVGMKSFPPSIANMKQRLGRSGRSSGNAYNTVVLSRKPHDSYYWEQPQNYFEGEVDVPGCEYKNQNLISRQYNAFLFDAFASTHQDLKLPKMNDMRPGDLLVESTYWVSFRNFLEGNAVGLIPKFLAEVEKDYSSKNIIQTLLSTQKSGLKDYLEQIHQNNYLWQLVSDNLNLFDAKRIAIDTELAEINDKLDSLQSNHTDEDDQKIEYSELKRAQRRLRNKRLNLNRSEYIYTTLANKGILPNYAFPEEGTELSYYISVPTGKTSDNPKERYQTISGSIDRSPRQALRELAPGQSYYIAGHKLPISRIPLTKDYSNRLSVKIVCAACGSVSPTNNPSLEKALDTFKTGGSLGYSNCPECVAQANLELLLDFKLAEAGTNFRHSQIRDKEESRETQSQNVECFINFPKKENEYDLSQGITWVSKEALTAFEFKTNAEIHFINANIESRDSESREPKYHRLCASCGAIANEDTKGSINYGDYGSNHSYSCEFKNIEPIKVPSLLVSLSRNKRSDVVRVLASRSELLPTLAAVLKKMMKTLLKGSPGHLVIERSILKTAENGHQYILNMFDDVPGGTGHLASLMSFDGSKLSDKPEKLNNLRTILTETLKAIESCPCERGCYSCLWEYSNQFEHENIHKGDAVNWIKEVINANDWEASENSLGVNVGNDAFFDSSLEQAFSNQLISNNALISGGPLIFRHVDSDGTRVHKCQFANSEKKAGIEFSGHRNVKLMGFEIPYTKPDFTIYNQGKLSAYLYLDGSKYHLNPGAVESTFQKVDTKVRPFLQGAISNQEGRFIPALTFSDQMIEAWKKSDLDNSDVAKKLYDTPQSVNIFMLAIANLFYQNDNGVEWKEVRAIWVAQLLGFYLGNTEIPVMGQEKKTFEAFIKAIDKHNPDNEQKDISFKSFLTIENGEPVLHFPSDWTSEEYKSGEKKIDPDFIIAWEAYWIINHLLSL